MTSDLKSSPIAAFFLHLPYSLIPDFSLCYSVLYSIAAHTIRGAISLTKYSLNPNAIGK